MHKTRGSGHLAISVAIALSMLLVDARPAKAILAFADNNNCPCCQIDEPPIQEVNKAASIALASEELHIWRASLQREGIHFDVGQRDVIFLGGDENHHIYQVAFLPDPLPSDEVSGVVVVVDTIAEKVVADARIDISAEEGNGRTLFVYMPNGDILQFPYQHDYSNINWACWRDCMLWLFPEILLGCCLASSCFYGNLIGCAVCIACTGAAGGYCAIACP